MTTRMLIAGLVGAIVMFLWMGVAHVATPLAQIGFSKLPNETAVAQALHTGTGDRAGLFYVPWEPDVGKDPAASKRLTAAIKANGQALIVYQPSTASPDLTTGELGMEFVKEVVVCLIAAFLLAQSRLTAFWARAGFVAAIGVIAGLETNGSYRFFYGFPTDYTVVMILVSVVGYALAGLAIAAVLRRGKVGL